MLILAVAIHQYGQQHNVVIRVSVRPPVVNSWAGVGRQAENSDFSFAMACCSVPPRKNSVTNVLPAEVTAVLPWCRGAYISTWISSRRKNLSKLLNTCNTIINI